MNYVKKGYKRKVNLEELVSALQTDPTLSHADAARRFGVSRELIRYHAGRLLGETGLARRAVNPAVAKAKAESALRRVQKRRKTPWKWVTLSVNRWLRQVGHFYCHICHRAVALEQRAKCKGVNRCKPCVAKLVREYLRRKREERKEGKNKC